MDHNLKNYQRAQVCHFSKADERWGEFGNMTGNFGFRLTANGPLIPSVENLYQAMRYTAHPEIQQRILEQKSGFSAKLVSKKYRKTHTRADFEEKKMEIMKWCLYLKLANHPHRFGGSLINTGDRDIVEESKKDDWWGAKPQQNDPELLIGKNILGQLLMELRDSYKSCVATGDNSYKLVIPPAMDDFTFLGIQVPIVDKR